MKKIILTVLLITIAAVATVSAETYTYENDIGKMEIFTEGDISGISITGMYELKFSNLKFDSKEIEGGYIDTYFNVRYAVVILKDNRFPHA